MSGPPPVSMYGPGPLFGRFMTYMLANIVSNQLTGLTGIDLKPSNARKLERVAVRAAKESSMSFIEGRPEVHNGRVTRGGARGRDFNRDDFAHDLGLLGHADPQGYARDNFERFMRLQLGSARSLYRTDTGSRIRTLQDLQGLLDHDRVREELRARRPADRE